MSKPIQTLSEFDWKFDDVPAPELVACCYWEYARESVFFINFKKLWDTWDTSKPCPKEIGEGLHRVDDAPKTTRNFLHAFLGEKAFPCSWQTLSAKTRLRLAQLDFQFPPPFKRGGDRTEAEHLLRQAEQYSKSLRAETDKIHRMNPGVGEGTLRLQGKWPQYEPKSSVHWEEGYESTIVQIGWDDYTDEELVAAFKIWVAGNRPEGKGVASRKGKRVQKGYGSYLNWLGMMRLMNVYPFTSMEKCLPAAWSRYRSVDWPRARKEAINRYREFFSFLSGEPPIHASTAGRRSKLVGTK